MKISKRDRELAAKMASACACAGEHQRRVLEEGFPDGLHGNAFHLFCKAYYATPEHTGYGVGRTAERARWAEAEAMIRCGWSPEPEID